jgi:hypothetical protein
MNPFKITEGSTWTDADLSPLQKRALAAKIIQYGRRIPNDASLLYELEQQEIASRAREKRRSESDQTYYDRENARLAAEASEFQKRKLIEDAKQAAALAKREKDQIDGFAKMENMVYSQLPEQWPALFRQQRMNEWKEQHRSHTQQQLYEFLKADDPILFGGLWYDCNTLIKTCPPNPTKTPFGIVDNYYDNVLPWAAVRALWARSSQRDTSQWTVEMKFKNEFYLTRTSSFTFNCEFKPAVAAFAEPFAWGTMFAAIGALLVFAIVKT